MRVYVFLAILSFFCCQAGDLPLQVGYRSYADVGDMFGVAQLLRHLLDHSRDLTEVLSHPGAIIKAACFVGGIAAIVKISLLGVQALSVHIPSFYKSFIFWCKRALKLPEGFDIRQLLVWERVFDHVIKMASSQQYVRGRCSSDAHRWQYCRTYMQDMLYYIVGYLAFHQRYYRSKQARRPSRGLVLKLFGTDNDTDHVCFMVDTMIRLLRHIISVVQRVEKREELDVGHIKRISAMVQVLFRQLRFIIDDAHGKYGYDQYGYGYGAEYQPFVEPYDITEWDIT